ncbi:MAG TPA: DUF1269 domain-containing protein [Ktedonobacterales bacterium]|jgi:uncharacterized membrane protein|nr:DUF1269 domain-containing protein [Ktedonobacterales bacterium]
MTLGPVQIIAIGLDNDKQRGDVARELRAASDQGIIRVIDLLAIRKEQDGSIISLGATDLSPDQRMEFGAMLGGLLGLGAAGEEGAEIGAVAGAEAFSERTFGLSDDDIRDLARDIPPGKTAVMMVIEHRWAVPLKEAIERTGGVVLGQGMVQPESLVLAGAALAAAADTVTDESIADSGV